MSETHSNDTTVPTEDSGTYLAPLEAMGVLAAIFSVATTLPGWGEGVFQRAELTWAGDLEMALRSEAFAGALADRLGLAESSRSARRAVALYQGQDTREIAHYAKWDGVYAGHGIEVRAYWTTPLGELDLAEGEYLA